MSVTFTKLFSSITESTVWAESDQTRLVWITMLAMADKHGRVWASIPGLANRARVPIEACEEALRVFMSPDPYSRTIEKGGQRIEEIDGGWTLLNHAKYRATRDEMDRGIYKSEKEAERRSKGYVYYAQNGGLIKIGFSKNPWARVSEMRTACPEISLVGVEIGIPDLEKERHRQFDSDHFSLEWFKLSESLEKHILSLEAIDKPKKSIYNEARSSGRKTCSVVELRSNVSDRSTLRDLRSALRGHNAEADTEAITPISPFNVSPEMVAKEGLKAAGITSDKVFNQVCDQMRLISPDGFSDDEADKMIEKISSSWKSIMTAFSQGKLTHTPWGAEKFFGEGFWKDSSTWPWKDGAQPVTKAQSSSINNGIIPSESIDPREFFKREMAK